MLKRAAQSLALLVITSIPLLAQPAVDYPIDTDGDGTPNGILYRDEVYDVPADIIAYTDHLAGPPAFTYARNLALYNGDSTSLRMDVYVPDSGSDTLAAKDKPVIFFFYGGGFYNGTSRRVEDLCLQYASRGYVAVAPNYRLGYYGAYPEDSIALCDTLISASQAVYRAMVDAKAAMRWVADSLGLQTGIDVSADHFLVHGPSIFPMLSHMQDPEVPLFLRSLGTLDDGIRIRGSVGRSTSLILADRFINKNDTAPLLIFHGTCDKSVPFQQTLLSTRNGCDTVYPAGTPIPGDVMVYGSYDIMQAVRHYVEYYPICGLHHSHKDIEANEMKEPIAAFLYNVTVGHVRASDPSLFHPFIVAPCDVNGKCTKDDLYGWCTGAELLPPKDGIPCARLAGENVAAAEAYSAVVYPNPAQGTLTVRWTAFRAGPVSMVVYNALGERILEQPFTAHTGLNHGRFTLPADAAPGMYAVQLDGRPASTIWVP